VPGTGHCRNAPYVCSKPSPPSLRPTRGPGSVLDALITGEKPVGAIVNELPLSQPQVSKHLRVLSEVGLVRCRAEGRRRLYRLEPAPLRPLHEWLAKYKQAWNERLVRMDDYLKELQRQGEPQ
jgi:DNA-binding transcriptional ArsR family regulator